jgi:Ca-activated chloride channel family protein
LLGVVLVMLPAVTLLLPVGCSRQAEEIGEQPAPPPVEAPPSEPIGQDLPEVEDFRYKLAAALEPHLDLVMDEGQGRVALPGAIAPGVRTGPVKEKLLREGGGNTRSEAAVALGIKWIVRHQALEGFWSFDRFCEHGKCNCTYTGESNDILATGFALLPLLGAGHTDKGTPYGSGVPRAVKFLVNGQRSDGYFGGDVMGHAVATLALCEVYGLTANRDYKGPAQRGLDWLVRTQRADGGWNDCETKNLLVAVWSILALKSGAMAGLSIPNSTWAKINDYLDALCDQDGGRFGSNGRPQPRPAGNPPEAASAAGLLCRQYLGWGPRNSALQRGLEELRKSPPAADVKDHPAGRLVSSFSGASLFYYYFATQVVHHMAPFHPEAWDQWNPKMRDLLIDSQDQGLTPDRRDQKGSWAGPLGDVRGGRLLSTCLAVLTLETYYRHLPLYRRELGAQEDEAIGPAIGGLPMTIPPPPGYGGNVGQGGGIDDGRAGQAAMVGFAGGPGGRSGSTREAMLRQSGGNPGRPFGPGTDTSTKEAPKVENKKLPDPFEPHRGEVEHNTEHYQHFTSNPFLRVAQQPLSTFSTDVDTASYSLVRRFLRDENRLPPPDAVRIEELINYFDYDYPLPVLTQPGSPDVHPVTITPEVAACPWNKNNRLVRVAIAARRIKTDQTPGRNLVFLIDVSGSMGSANRLPLVQQSLGLLIDQLTAKDRVSIVVYAGDAGVRLHSTPGSEKQTIRDAVNSLHAGGSTNGAGGIVEAYKEALRNFMPGGVNRVILATDGDFNVGVTNQGDLVRLIEDHRDKGIYLTALGYGMGNLKDSTIMKLANHGHGHYAYIDSLAEANKVFVEEGMALVTLAQDVKIQVEFNPKAVEAYRLIGYEKRLMRDQDFNDDTKHAAVLGCGHRVTVLYEVVPAGMPVDVPKVDPLRYQAPPPLSQAANSGELMAVKLRYKEPMAQKSKLMEVAVADKGGKFDQASEDFRFAAAVAAFAGLLRDKPAKAPGINLAGVRELAESAKGADARGLRAEFIELVKIAERLMK